MIKSLLLILLSSSFASANLLPHEIRSYIGKSGKLISTIDGQAVRGEHGNNCTIELSPYNPDMDSVQITAGTYFTPIAHLEGAKKDRVQGGWIFTTTSDGRRPGGSVCGDMVPLTSYKKTLELQGKTLTIRQVFRCFFEKTTIVQACVTR